MVLGIRSVDDRDTFDADKRKGRHDYMVAPTLHVVGLSLLFLAPGLLFALLVEWGSPTSHDEWALVLALAVTLIVGGALWFPTSVGRGITTRSVCLLYTSPSPRDATLSRMPSSA